MIYQFIPFNNEVEILNLQFIINYDFVDKFIISESNTTFSGIPKEYNFKKHSIFDKFSDKIIYDKVKTDNINDLPDIAYNRAFKVYWQREQKQRELYFKTHIFNDDDIIIFTDADEIVFLKNVIDKINKDTLNYFNITHCRYYINTQIRKNEILSKKIACFTYKTYLEKYKNLSEKNYSVRDLGKLKNDYLEHHECGYHLSACYDIKEKLESFSHGEFNNDTSYNECVQQKSSLTKDNIIDIPEIILSNIDSKFIYS